MKQTIQLGKIVTYRAILDAVRQCGDKISAQKQILPFSGIKNSPCYVVTVDCVGRELEQFHYELEKIIELFLKRANFSSQN